MSNAGDGIQIMVQGRLVWLSGKTPFLGKPKIDQNTKQPRFNKQNEPMIEYGFGLAVPVAELSKPGSIWEAAHKEALTLYPNGQIPPGFAMKYKTEQMIDPQGQPYSLREGYAGHIVFACTTSIPIKFFKWENGANVLINDGIKCGDYVNVQLTIKAHPAQGQGKAGLYLNPNAVQFLGYGKEIINTPTGDQLFGTAAPAMPMGASAVPLAPQPGQMLMPPPGGQPAYPQQPMYPPQATMAPMTTHAPPTYQQPPQAPAAPQPHYGVLPPQHQPPPGGAPMAYPPQQPPPPNYAPQPVYPQQPMGMPPIPQ